MSAPRPIIFVVVEPRTASDQDKLTQGLGQLASEDPTLRIDRGARTGQTIIGGMGEVHLDLILDRLQREFQVQATCSKPQVAYREALTKPAEGEGRYVHQTGGRGHYAHVKVRLLPAEAGTGSIFESPTGDDVIPGKFVQSIEAGIQEALGRGVLAGYPIDDVRVELYGGSYHHTDSSDIAFRTAGSMAFQEAAKRAGPVVLEPIMAVEVTVPEAYMSGVIRDLNLRRGRIEAMCTQGTAEIIRGRVPLAELLGYANDLRSLTSGRASHSLRFDRYEPLSGGPYGQDDDRVAPVMAPRRDPPRGKSSGVSLPEPNNE